MNIVVVAAMGFCGACLRFFISDTWGTMGGFPITTLLINVSGCFILGWFYTLSVHRLYVHPLLRLGIGTGFLGAFTTFSTFVIETWKLMDANLYGLAEVYVLLTIFMGLSFAWLGHGLGTWQTNLRLSSRTRSR